MVRERVVFARGVQAARFISGKASVRTNAKLSTHEVQDVAMPDEPRTVLMNAAIERLGFSARDYNIVLRVARTIADLDESSGVRATHVAEAVQLRKLSF